MLERVLAEPGLDQRDITVMRGGLYSRHPTPSGPSQRLAALRTPSWSRCWDDPLRELVTVDGPFPRTPIAAARSTDRGAVLSPRGRDEEPRHRQGHQRHIPHGRVGLERAAAMGFDVVYLPPIHPIGGSTARARNNTLTPGRMTPARRGRSGRTVATTRSTRTSARSEFDAFVAKAQGSAGDRARLRAAGGARSPWATSNPYFTHPAGRHHRLTRRTRRRSTRDIYPIASTTIPGDLRRSGRIALLMSQGADAPRGQPAQAARVLGMALERIRADRPRRAVLVRGRSPADDAMGWARSATTSPTRTSWRTEKTGIEDYLREVSRPHAHLMRAQTGVNT